MRATRPVERTETRLLRRLPPPPPPLESSALRPRIPGAEGVAGFRGALYGGHGRLMSLSALEHVFGKHMAVGVVPLPELVEAARRAHARVVLVDGSHPARAMDTVRALREQPETASARIIVLESRLGGPSGRPLFLLAGADDILDASRGRFVLLARLAGLLPDILFRRDAARATPARLAKPVSRKGPVVAA